METFLVCCGICLCLFIGYLMASGAVLSDDTLNKNVSDIVSEHRRELSLHYLTLIYKDESNQLVTSKFRKEILNFISKVILQDGRFSVFKNKLERIDEDDCFSKSNLVNLVTYKTILMCECELKNEYTNDKNINFDSANPINYELLCAKKLISLGWDAKLTKSTGDQGADIIAEKNSTTVVIQCKKYSNSVGNKAVQEVIGGIKYYNADFGCVVTNSKYTSSAKKLAKVSGVFLLHHSQLGEIENIVSNLLSSE